MTVASKSPRPDLTQGSQIVRSGWNLEIRPIFREEMMLTEDAYHLIHPTIKVDKMMKNPIKFSMKNYVQLPASVNFTPEILPWHISDSSTFTLPRNPSGMTPTTAPRHCAATPENVASRKNKLRGMIMVVQVPGNILKWKCFQMGQQCSVTSKSHCSNAQMLL